MNLKGMTVVAATGNEHKLREIKTITEAFGIKIISKEEAGAAGMDVEETGTTFEENSFIKAEAIRKATGISAIADDSGLEVMVLDGAPGVYSARFSGEDATDESNNLKLLELMNDVPDDQRQARFVSVITLCFENGDVLTARGECPGRVLRQPAGTGGFGYDPLFLPDGCEETFAQLSGEEKNLISHRARALSALGEQLAVYGNEEIKEQQ